jgi:hypothetical protein
MTRLAPIESYLITDNVIAYCVYLLSTLNLKGKYNNQFVTWLLALGRSFVQKGEI